MRSRNVCTICHPLILTLILSNTINIYRGEIQPAAGARKSENILLKYLHFRRERLKQQQEEERLIEIALIKHKVEMAESALPNKRPSLSSCFIESCFIGIQNEEKHFLTFQAKFSVCLMSFVPFLFWLVEQIFMEAEKTQKDVL